MPLPLLALAAAPAVAKGLLGAFQLSQNVKRVDTTTDAEREQLALARQASAATLPGLAQYQARLAQGQNAATQNAALGSGSASDFLATSGAADRVRQQGENQLGAQYEQYRDRATGQLQRQLAAYAAHQQADTDRAAQANSTLQGAGLQNLSGALSDGASIATYGALSKSNAPSNPFDASKVNKLPFTGPGNTEAADAAGYRPGAAFDTPYYRRRTGPYRGYIG